jgi:uncharacterized protein YqhQ
MPQGEYLQYGGQAIVEGVMMRSPRFFSVACRAPNGEIIVKTEAIEKTWIGRQQWLKRPFLRGSLALLDAMALGIRAMRFAAGIQIDERYADPSEATEAEKAPRPIGVRIAVNALMAVLGAILFAVGQGWIELVPLAGAMPRVLTIGGLGLFLMGAWGAVELMRHDPAKEERQPSARVQDVAIGGTMIVSLGFGMFLFNYVPNFVAESSQRVLDVKDFRVTNLVAEIVKVVIFLGYIGLIGLLPDIRRVFQYHGAEHKAINALEAEQALTPENCATQTRLHPRCGTSFAIIVLILGLLTFTFVPRYPVTGQPGSVFLDTTLRFLIELLILPLIAGAAYELLRIAGKFRNQAFVNAAFKPGIWSQYLTTREPDAEQIEVALASLQAVIDAEEGAAAPGPEEPNVLESAPDIVAS